MTGDDEATTDGADGRDDSRARPSRRRERRTIRRTRFDEADR